MEEGNVCSVLLAWLGLDGWGEGRRRRWKESVRLPKRDTAVCTSTRPTSEQYAEEAEAMTALGRDIEESEKIT